MDIDPAEATFYGNTIANWLVAAGVTVAVLFVLFAIRGLAARRLRRRAEASDTDFAEALGIAAGLVRRIAWPFLTIVAIEAGAYFLVLPDKAVAILDAALVIVVFLQLALICSYGLVTWANSYVQKKADRTVKTTFGAVRFLGQVAIWSLAGLLVLDNLGIDITALVAGLGIGGIAVAFALQSILGDIFASISIILDKPFEVGDFIIVGDLMGTVEYVGVKTTRLRSLSGEQIVMSNSDLLQSRIRNYKRMNERRVTFSLGVTYQTPPEKLETVPGIIREAIEGQDKTRFDRAHFSSFGDFALVFEVVYYMLEPDYNLMMDTQQAINLDLFRRFAEDGIEFAYPTQTIHLDPATGGIGTSAHPEG